MGSICLDIIHSEKARVEYFLNNGDQKLEQIPFDAQELTGVDDVVAGFKFKEAGQSTFVIVIFASSYFHANEIQAANLAIRPNINIEAIQLRKLNNFKLFLNCGFSSNIIRISLYLRLLK